MPFHLSQFANSLKCAYCGKIQGTKNWPLNGDLTPFYWQREPGNFSLAILCPNCGKEWYVVWDFDPGPIESLDVL